MGHKYQISLISDSTGETLDRIFLALKSQFSNFDYVKNEIESAKKLFKMYNWPVIDVTIKSVEETAASIIRIFDIGKNKK